MSVISILGWIGNFFLSLFGLKASRDQKERLDEQNKLMRMELAHKNKLDITVGMHEADNLLIALTKNIVFINKKPVGASLISYRIENVEVLPEGFKFRILPAPQDAIMDEKTPWEITESKIYQAVEEIVGDQNTIDSVLIRFEYEADNGFNYFTKRKWFKGENGRWLKKPPDPECQPIIE